MIDVSAEIHCGRCGSANYSLPSGTEAESVIRCNDCGEEMGTLVELADTLMAEILAHSAEAQRQHLDREGQGTAGPA